ncbi:MAG: hypothetical protein GX376_05040 [Firmicutes bacterium]|nr:hypothetical protein [Bacillota bacterium]
MVLLVKDYHTPLFLSTILAYFLKFLAFSVTIQQYPQSKNYKLAIYTINIILPVQPVQPVQIETKGAQWREGLTRKIYSIPFISLRMTPLGRAE